MSWDSNGWGEDARSYHRDRLLHEPPDDVLVNGEEDPRPRIQLIAFNEIELTSERRYLVPGIVPRVGLTVAWGPPKSGKSFFVFDLAMHVAAGWEYRDRATAEGPVVYCAFEGGFGFTARVEAFRRQHLADKPHVGLPFFLMPLTLNLSKQHRALIAAIKATLEEPPVLVVLDTLNRSIEGSESNDGDMSRYVRAADALREAFSCAVIIVHHCGIDGSRPRGHTSLTGACDAQLSVTRDGAGNVIVTVEDMKDGQNGTVIACRLVPADLGMVDEAGTPITSCIVEPVEDAPQESRKPAKRLTAAAQIALRALEEAVDEVGEVPPESNHIPKHTRCVTVEQWKDYAFRRGISASDESAAKRAAFRRASQALIAAKHASVWGEQAWKA
jgi:AAA domain